MPASANRPSMRSLRSGTGGSERVSSRETSSRPSGHTAASPATNQEDVGLPSREPESMFPPSSIMADAEVVSLSRASSVISTGTKISTSTLSHQPPEQSTSTYNGSIDILLGRRNFRISARPGSILSISSFDHPAPPYSEVNPEGAASSATLIHDLPEEDEEQPSYPSDVLPTIPEPPYSEDAPLSPIPIRPPISVPSATETPPDAHDPSSRTPSPPSPPLSPLSSSENAISAHYTAVVRTIDTNHRAEIARQQEAHQMALHQLRHDIDAAYRLEFRAVRDACDTQTASLRSQVEALEAELETRRADDFERDQGRRDEVEKERDEAVRKARNEVEDLWEGRWRDRMRLAGEEVGAAYGERKRVGRCWEEEVRRRWPALADEVRAVVETKIRKERAGERRGSASGSEGGK